MHRYLAPLVLTIALLAGCGPAKAPRENARAVVLSLAEGVKVADKTCAVYAIATRDLQLAEVCASLVGQARDNLITAEDGIALWGAAAAEDIPCVVKHTAEIMTRMGNELQRAGSKLPLALVDALTIAPMLAGVCRE